MRLDMRFFQSFLETSQEISFIDPDAVESRIFESWERRRPFSLIRLGDGENTVLRYPDMTTDERAQKVFFRAMENRRYSDKEIHDVRIRTIAAVKSADIVGMYDSFHHHEECVVFQEHLEYAGIGGFVACNPAVHYTLQCTGAIDRLIRKADRVTLICGRDVRERFSTKYHHAEVDQILIPTERQYRLIEDRERISEPHYPDAFYRIISELKVDGPRHLFLIGGGLLGKPYCHEVKIRGGFAIDIGSVFDYWGEVPTREGRGPLIKAGKLEFEGESRWPGVMLGDSPRPNEFKRKFRERYRPMKIVSRTKLGGV